MFPIQLAQYCDILSKVVGVTLFNTDYPILRQIKKSSWANLPTLHPPPPPPLLKRWDGNFECDFSVKYGG